MSNPCRCRPRFSTAEFRSAGRSVFALQMRRMARTTVVVSEGFRLLASHAAPNTNAQVGLGAIDRCAADERPLLPKPAVDLSITTGSLADLLDLQPNATDTKDRPEA